MGLGSSSHRPRRCRPGWMGGRVRRLCSGLFELLLLLRGSRGRLRASTTLAPVQSVTPVAPAALCARTWEGPMPDETRGSRFLSLSLACLGRGSRSQRERELGRVTRLSRIATVSDAKSDQTALSGFWRRTARDCVSLRRTALDGTCTHMALGEEGLLRASSACCLQHSDHRASGRVQPLLAALSDP